MRAVTSIGPSIAEHLVASAGRRPSDVEALLFDVHRDLARRDELGLDAGELDLVILQLGLLLAGPSRDVLFDEQAAQKAVDGNDILRSWFFERQPKFDSKAPYDLGNREARVDIVTMMSKSIARHLTASLGPGKPEDSARLMDDVWNSLNRLEWLGLNKEEAGILLFQLHFLLATSLLP
jgi:hypothetical protein